MAAKRQKLRADSPPEEGTVCGKGLVVRREPADSSVRLQLEGELTFLSAPVLDQCIRRNEEVGRELVLDLAPLSFVDSSGLGVLIEAAKRAGRGGWSIKTENPRGMVLKVFEITEMSSLLEYCQRSAAEL